MHRQVDSQAGRPTSTSICIASLMSICIYIYCREREGADRWKEGVRGREGERGRER